VKKTSYSVPVLMYHHVSPSPGAITCTPEHFEDQLRWLRRRGYVSLDTARFAGHLAGSPAPERSVLITFDDGYLDNWVYAAPLLAQYGFSAVLFIVTGWLGQGAPRARLGDARLPETPDHERCKALIEAGRADDVMLRWSEVRAMREAGVFEFHCHTHTHTRWDLGPQAFAKNAHMREELMQSRMTLERELGGVSEHLCWPQGYFDEDYIRIARECGFRYLYTTQAFGQNRIGSDPAHIHRFAVRNTTGASVGRRIRVAAHPVLGPIFNRWKRLRRRLRNR